MKTLADLKKFLEENKNLPDETPLHIEIFGYVTTGSIVDEIHVDYRRDITVISFDSII